MAICPNCGFTVDGPVCLKCGAAQAMPGPAFASSKIMGPVAWLILALLALGAAASAAVVFAGVALVRSLIPPVEQSSGNPDQGAQALARFLTSTHPEVEVLSVEQKNDRVTLRDRKTGKVVTQTIESARAGKFRFQEGVTVSPEEAALPDFSAGLRQPAVITDIDKPLKLPEWIPTYPFSEPHGALPSPSGGTFRFDTRDTLSEVLAFYQEALKRSGFQITATGTTGEAKTLKGTLTAMDARSDRNVLVNAESGAGGTTVTVTFSHK